MAARELPLPEVTHSITIGANFVPSSPGIVVGYGDTVTFTNNSGSDITIQFLSNTPGAALYPNMNLPVLNGTSSGFQVPGSDCAANYNIAANGVVQNAQPYVIQVGVGPMFVLVTGPLNLPNFNPGMVAVPLGDAANGMGMLEMKSQVPNAAIPIYWGTNPFNPGITQTGPPQPVQSGITPEGYTYTSSPGPDERAGGGTVIIRSS
jgi:hypothetical protein